MARQRQDVNLLAVVKIFLNSSLCAYDLVEDEQNLVLSQTLNFFLNNIKGGGLVSAILLVSNIVWSIE